MRETIFQKVLTEAIKLLPIELQDKIGLWIQKEHPSIWKEACKKLK